MLRTIDQAYVRKKRNRMKKMGKEHRLKTLRKHSDKRLNSNRLWQTNRIEYFQDTFQDSSLEFCQKCQIVEINYLICLNLYMCTERHRLNEWETEILSFCGCKLWTGSTEILQRYRSLSCNSVKTATKAFICKQQPMGVRTLSNAELSAQALAEALSIMVLVTPIQSRNLLRAKFCLKQLVLYYLQYSNIQRQTAITFYFYFFKICTNVMILF